MRDEPPGSRVSFRQVAALAVGCIATHALISAIFGPVPQLVRDLVTLAWVHVLILLIMLELRRDR